MIRDIIVKDAGDTGERWECFCGSANCPGYAISSFFSLSEGQQRVYLPYAPKFIQDEYRRQSHDVL